ALFSQSRSIGQTIEHAVQLLSPAAALRSIEIRVDVAPQVRELAAGPIYPIIANALRNSIEAIGRSDASTRHIIEINGAWLDDIIELSVADTGPGLAASLVDESGRFAFGRSTKPRRGH